MVAYFFARLLYQLPSQHRLHPLSSLCSVFSSNSHTQNPKTMSIVPISGQSGTSSNPSALDVWDPEGFFSSLDLWDPFQNFPFSPLLSSHFPSFAREIFPSLETQVNWKETPRAHVFRAVFPGFNRDDVLVYIDDDDMLQISTENGKFMTKFKLPDNAVREQVQASMVNGVLTVTIPKEAAAIANRPNVRAIEISGSG